MFAWGFSSCCHVARDFCEGQFPFRPRDDNRVHYAPLGLGGRGECLPLSARDSCDGGDDTFPKGGSLMWCVGGEEAKVCEVLSISAPSKGASESPFLWWGCGGGGGAELRASSSLHTRASGVPEIYCAGWRKIAAVLFHRVRKG